MARKPNDPVPPPRPTGPAADVNLPATVTDIKVHKHERLLRRMQKEPFVAFVFEGDKVIAYYKDVDAEWVEELIDFLEESSA